MSIQLSVLGAKIADFTVNKFFYLWDVWTLCSMYVCICFLLPRTQISICVMQKAFILKIVNFLFNLFLFLYFWKGFSTDQLAFFVGFFPFHSVSNHSLIALITALGSWWYLHTQWNIKDMPDKERQKTGCPMDWVC